MTIGNWNGYTFEVSSRLIRGFNGLSIKGSCETKDKKSGKQKYVKRKAAQPAEISLTVQLNALTGVTDVRSEGMKLVKSARDGTSAYFYIGDSKLVPCKVMLVSATVDNVQMVGSKWVCCDVKLTLKQSTKDGGGGAGGKRKKSKKKSAKKSGGAKGGSAKGGGAKGGGTGGGATTEVDAITGADPSLAKKKAEAQVVAYGIANAAKAASKAAKNVYTGIKTAITKATVKKPAQKTTSVTKPATTGRVASARVSAFNSRSIRSS